MQDVLPISGKTKLLSVIGSPVSHSRSPLMHNASFEQLGINAVYVALDVDLESLPVVAPALAKMGVAGYNVTMPCKQAVMAYVDELSDSAKLIGAVNTVSIRDGKAYGDNTDGKGFWQNCREYGFEIEGKTALILGAGGAGSAIFVEAALEGAKKVIVLNRKGANFNAAVERASKVSDATGCPISALDLEDQECLASSCAECDIVVNCTKVGMCPDEESNLVSPELMHEGMTVADTVYNPLETKMIVEAKKLGLNTIPGLGMLLWQGAIAEEIWFPGAKMDVDHIQKVLGL